METGSANELKTGKSKKWVEILAEIHKKKEQHILSSLNDCKRTFIADLLKSNIGATASGSATTGKYAMRISGRNSTAKFILNSTAVTRILIVLGVSGKEMLRHECNLELMEQRLDCKRLP
jgi:hypothetical protein